MIEITLNPGQCGFTGWLFDKLLPPLITGAVITAVASYLLPRANERYRARRDHLLKDVDLLRSQVDALVALCLSYWTEPKAALELQIELKLSSISSLVRNCAPDLWSTKNKTGPDLVARLYFVCRTAEFGSSALPPADANQARAIAETAAELIEFTDEARHKFLTKTRRPEDKPQKPAFGS